MTANSSSRKATSSFGSRFANVATELSLLAVLVIMIVVFSVASPFFLTVTNMVNHRADDGHQWHRGHHHDVGDRLRRH